MARKLKIYAAEIDGLNEWIVAAPNRPAALEAFGVNQDLFAQGMAHEDKNPDHAAAALKAPGTPLRRPKGSKAAFAPASGAADWSAAEPKEAKRKSRKPDRKRLDRAEAHLADVEQRHEQALEDIAAERRELDARQVAEEKTFSADHRKAKAGVAEAADAYAQAGGR